MCQKRLQIESARASFAREWAAALHQNVHTLAQRLEIHANVIAGTTSGIVHDERFGDAAPARKTFDLLILENSELIGEAELLQAVRRARRWVLVGQPVPTGEPSADPPPDRITRKAVQPLHRGHAAVVGQRPFQRLWERLHCEPRSLPYSWLQENGQWCCRLRSVSAEERPRLESERVADCPDIELRILAQPQMAPALAEVVFPRSMSLIEAKQFIFHELQELPIQAPGHGYFWSEEPDKLVLRLCSAAAAVEASPVPLQSGICELVVPGAIQSNGETAHPLPGHTCSIEFDRHAGWDRPRAEEWLRRHLGVRDWARTVQLAIPYRMHADLAAVVFDLLLLPPLLHGRPAAGAEPLVSQDGHTAAVEFVPVPSLACNGESQKLSKIPAVKPDAGRRVAGSLRPRVPKATGAGLELELGDPKQRDRLPAEVRPALPQQGIVNWAEAQAIIQVLEDLAQRSAQENAQTTPAVGVIALRHAQVELIRTLIGHSPLLASSRLAISVGEPSAFQQREFGIVLLGLTRSHSHRAVPYTDGPHILAAAMTRARAKLVLFGDPGTLERRCQWQGAVEHLDEAAAAGERNIAVRLLRYLQGQGAHPRAFHVHQGQCT
jgi:hypothetical protein